MRSWMGRVSALAPVTMIVHDLTSSPVFGFFHLSHRPAKAQHATICRADEIGSLAIWLGDPFIITACRNDAAMALERVPEHRRGGDTLRSRVECRRQLLQRRFPPVRNEAPAHRHKFGGAACGGPYDLYGVGRRDIVVGLKIARGTSEIATCSVG